MFNLESHRRIEVSEYQIFFTVVPNTECKEQRIRDRLPARRRRRDNKRDGFQTRNPSIFVTRAIRITQVHKCRPDLPLAYKRISYVRHYSGAFIDRVESRCGVPSSPSQKNSRGINVRTRSAVNLRRLFLENFIKIACQIRPI
jgi:hypothetical protein